MPHLVGTTVDGRSFGGWTRSEALLTLSLLFESRTWGRVNQSQLLELGELIGRSPGSISFKVAGYRALTEGASPRTRRVSSVQRDLYREYRSRPVELLRKSERLRAKSLPPLPTARVEGTAARFPTAEALGRAADRCGFSRAAGHYFQHGRGQIRGLAVSSTGVLAFPREAQRFFCECRKIANEPLRRSRGFRRVESGDFDGFVRGVLRWKFPTLHPKELEGPGASAVREALVRPEIHRLAVAPEDPQKWTPDDVRFAQDRVRERLALDPHALCDPCLMLVHYAAHQFERKLGSILPPGRESARRNSGGVASEHMAA